MSIYMTFLNHSREFQACEENVLEKSLQSFILWDTASMLPNGRDILKWRLDLLFEPIPGLPW